MALPSRLRLLRVLRRQRGALALLALLAVGGLAWWSLPDRVDPTQLLAQQPPAAGGAPEAPEATESFAWPLDDAGRLQAQPALRQHFDRMLAQAPAPAARELLAQQARTELRPEQADAVLKLWDAYVGLQQRAWRVPVDVTQPDTWADALAERHKARREELGDDWAQAFYGADEARVRAVLAQQQPGGAR